VTGSRSQLGLRKEGYNPQGTTITLCPTDRCILPSQYFTTVLPGLYAKMCFKCCECDWLWSLEALVQHTNHQFRIWFYLLYVWTVELLKECQQLHVARRLNIPRTTTHIYALFYQQSMHYDSRLSLWFTVCTAANLRIGRRKTKLANTLYVR
jgi:hypothetical protein